MKEDEGRAEAAAKGLSVLCLGVGTIRRGARRDRGVPGVGLALPATAFLWRLRGPGRIRSVLKWMIPVLVFLGAYGLLLYLTESAGTSGLPSAHLLEGVAHLFRRAVGMIFAVFALEEALRPLAVRARAGGFRGGRMALMLGLSYQLVPVFLQSMEGIALSQRASSRFWWLRPSHLTRACSSLFLLSHRLSEALALALSLRLRHEGAEGTIGLQGLSSGLRETENPAKKGLEP